MADTKKKTTEVAVRKEFARVENIQPLFDTDRFEHMQRSAQALMHSTVLPDSIRGQSPSECFSNLIVACDIAMTYDLPLLSVVQNMNPIHGKILFSGQMVSSMLQSRLGVRLHYHYTGERGTTGYRVYVWDQDFSTLTDDQIGDLAPGKYPRGARMIDGSVGDWQTFGKNDKPMKQWTGTAQRNQLAYRGAREWARLYEPGHLLGVYSEDEFDYYEERTRRSAQAPVTIPAISASFADEGERPAKDVSADLEEADREAELIAAATGLDDGNAGEPAELGDDKRFGASDGDEELAYELDLSDGEVVEDSPFDPVDGDEEDEGDQESEASDPGDDEPDDPPFDPDDEDPVVSEGDEEEPDEPAVEPALTEDDLDSMREAEGFIAARNVCLKILKGERFRRADFEAQEEARKAVYGILAAFKDSPPVDQDVVLFRMWITVVDDIEELEDAWTAIQQTDGFTRQKPDGQGHLKTAVELAYQRFTPGGE